MAKYPRVREQNIAVFGESGSGKTVLVSSFFGATQDGSYQNNIWDLVALQTGQGNRLYQNYLGMRDMATVPMATRFSNTTYSFAVRLKPGSPEETKKRAFDELRLIWHDYPGEWFREDPSTDEEKNRRFDTFVTLLKSDVAILLVDGQELLNHAGEEERYLKLLFGNFRQSLMRLKPDLLAQSGPLVEFPRIWILALSKADLLPDWDVNRFRDMIVLKAADDVERTRECLAELVKSPEAFSFGEDFMLLSSAKFQLRDDGHAATEIDLTKRLGVELILPIASVLPLERRLLWQERLSIPVEVLVTLADGASEFVAALTGTSDGKLAKLLARFPVSKVARTRALKLIKTSIETSLPHLRKAFEEATADRENLKAMLVKFKLDLENGRVNKIIRTQI